MIQMVSVNIFFELDFVGIIITVNMDYIIMTFFINKNCSNTTLTNNSFISGLSGHQLVLVNLCNLIDSQGKVIHNINE
jgi:hypothetical protein